MPDDIVLSDADYPWPADRTRTMQPWGDVPHGPVFVVRHVHPDRAPWQLRTWAWCYQCGWQGPDRSGDPNSLRLVEDDAVWHYHQSGVRCGSCEQCLPDGALRRG